MSKTSKHALFLAAVITAAASGAAIAGTAPNAVERAVARVFGKKATKHIEHEKEGGRDVYSAERRTNLEVTWDGAGAVKAIEIDIPINLAPTAARNAARKALGTAPGEAAIVIRGDKMSYQFEHETSKGDMEVYVNARGVVEHKGLEGADQDDDND